ncbi:hypothetical protein BEWA_047890 [Theileria equi strain WA]|uniref:Uncharacterized protein n=1 Tax=Theileria equi strain WA TaxID=1537102 RepID=L1LB07_THEEQ|nr:hypothetical protein BEWA_047890 [Theileria equi strain WA]EKX72323.1 hypothetical protein BEWA_047890 [Theileria equi strain WA]|eukprot:XP_004831775.1 hypothetical protein BEWA_047890 [Theileria equi strain WA]
MSSIGVDIKHKCQQNDKKVKGRGTKKTCIKHGFKAYLRNVDIKTKGAACKVCRHKSNGIKITNLKYDGDELKNAYGSLLTDKHETITELSVFYSRTYDSNNDIIKKPLLLRIKDNSTYHWYSNADADDTEEDEQSLEPKAPANTRWKNIDGSKFYNGAQAQKDFKNALDKLTCKLHAPHYVDIFQNSDVEKKYSCPVCGRYDITVSEEKNSVPGYKKYKHSYNADVKSVKYKDVVLKLKDYEDGPMPLSEEIKNLTVYYWKEDKKHTKPLVMEVGVFSSGLVPLGNDGNLSDNDNTKWSMIIPETPPDNGLLELSEKELPLKLQEHKCKLFQTVEINVSVKTGNYENKYCKEVIKKEKCTNENSHKEVQVTGYNGHVPTGYGAFRHTYKNDGETKTFTITDFKGGPKVSFPIWEVTELVVFFASCTDPNDNATKTPLLVYVGSDDGKTHKWYGRSNNEEEWQEEYRYVNLNRKSPQEAYSKGALKKFLDDIMENLGLQCPEDKKVEEIQPQQELGQTRSGETEEEEEEEDKTHAEEVKAKSAELEAPIQKLQDESLEKTTEVPAADLSDQVPDTESETKILLQETDRSDADKTEVGLGGAAPPGSVPAPTTPPLPKTEVKENKGDTDSHGEKGAPGLCGYRGITALPGGTYSAYQYLPGESGSIDRSSSRLSGSAGKHEQGDKGEAGPPAIKKPEVEGGPGKGTISFGSSWYDGFDFKNLIGRATPKPTTETQTIQALVHHFAQQSSVSGLGPPQPYSPGSNPPEIIKTTISVTTGILGTSALACFVGWKLYNRSKGDPWVRQI